MTKESQGVIKMIKHGVIFERFDLSRLSTQEQCLYKLALLGEICKLQMRRSSNAQKQKECQNLINLFGIILPANWGMIIFKPPRASSPPLCQLLEKELMRLLKLHDLYLIGNLYIQNLNNDHIKAMYPGDIVMPYWKDLEKTLVGNTAIYYLFRSLNKRDIGAEIEAIRGWYRIDAKRKHYKKEEGLRSFYYHEVVKVEGVFPYTMIGSAKYEDSGIHAPCSLSSRFLQLLSFMAVDANGINWARSCLSWLSK